MQTSSPRGFTRHVISSRELGAVACFYNASSETAVRHTHAVYNTRFISGLYNEVTEAPPTPLLSRPAVPKNLSLFPGVNTHGGGLRGCSGSIAFWNVYKFIVEKLLRRRVVVLVLSLPCSFGSYSKHRTAKWCIFIVIAICYELLFINWY